MISVGVDVIDFFDCYDEEYEDVFGSSFLQIEINKMYIFQFIEVFLIVIDIVIFFGSFLIQNGNGGGFINFVFR